MAFRRLEPVVFILEPYGGSPRRHNASLPHLYFDDTAVTRGDGVFETILVRDGQALNVERHLARFARSAAAFDLPEVNQAQWAQVTREAVAEWGEGEARCTWTLSRGRASTGLATAWLVVGPIGEAVVAQRERGVKVMTTTKGYRLTTTPEWLPVGAKSLSTAASMAALRYARENDFDDVIFLDDDEDTVLEAATSTVIVVKPGKKLRTPGGDVLAGTTQAALFAYAEEHGWRCKQRSISYDDLLTADSVWLVSSTRVAVRVRRLNEHKLPAGEQDDDVRALIDAALAAEAS